MEERIAGEECFSSDIELNTSFAVPRRVDYLDIDSADGNRLPIFEWRHVDIECVLWMEVVGNIVSGCEVFSSRDVVSMGVRIEDGDEFPIVLVDDRLVLVGILGCIEYCRLTVRNQDVREAPFPRPSDLD